VFWFGVCVCVTAGDGDDDASAVPSVIHAGNVNPRPRPRPAIVSQSLGQVREAGIRDRPTSDYARKRKKMVK
jgi:hypothetical protein